MSEPSVHGVQQPQDQHEQPPNLEWLYEWRAKEAAPPRAMRPSCILPELFLGGQGDVEDLALLFRTTHFRLLVSMNGPETKPPALHLRRAVSVHHESTTFHSKSSTSSSPYTICDIEDSCDVTLDSEGERLKLPKLTGADRFRILMKCIEQDTTEMYSSNDSSSLLSHCERKLEEWWDILNAAEKNPCVPSKEEEQQEQSSNTTSSVRCVFTFFHLLIPAKDSTNHPMSQYFPLTNALLSFIIQRKHCHVVVNCKLGMSRSSTVVMAYLIHQFIEQQQQQHHHQQHTHQWNEKQQGHEIAAMSSETFQQQKQLNPASQSLSKIQLPCSPEGVVAELLRFVRERRAFATPNPGFIAQLTEYLRSQIHTS